MAILRLGRTLVVANPASHSGKGAEAAERARLLYVALTRAREAVVLGVSAQMSKDGSLRPLLASGVCRALFG